MKNEIHIEADNPTGDGKVMFLITRDGLERFKQGKMIGEYHFEFIKDNLAEVNRRFEDD